MKMTEITVDFNCRKRINDSKKIEKILEEFKDPNALHGKEAVKALYNMMGMEKDYDDIPL